jgi:2-isopropylmalate synthase
MFGDPNNYIWMDGKFLPWDEAKIHVLTHTLHYGSGVFEGERAYNGKIFKMQEHHQRLHQSAALLDFKIPYSVEELNKAAQEVLKLCKLENAYLRPVAWYGSEALSVNPVQNSIHVAIAAWKWDHYFPEGHQGIKLCWSKWKRPSPESAPVHAKATGQYLIGTLSRKNADVKGFHDALFLDYRGFIAECSGANIFMVKDNILYTPIPDCILNGITRQTVIGIAKESNIKVVEKHILPQELIQADEIFITGTAVEVQPIIQIEKHNFKLGPITLDLLDKYKKLLGK